MRNIKFLQNLNIIMPQAAITVVINNSTKTYIYPDNSVTMPHAAITVVIDSWALIKIPLDYVTIPHAAITVVIVGYALKIKALAARLQYRTRQSQL